MCTPSYKVMTLYDLNYAPFLYSSEWKATFIPAPPTFWGELIGSRMLNAVMYTMAVVGILAVPT